MSGTQHTNELIHRQYFWFMIVCGYFNLLYFLLLQDDPPGWLFNIGLMFYIAFCFTYVIMGIGAYLTLRPITPDQVLNEIEATKDELPGISIIKPLYGKFPTLKANLESYFLLSYPKVEIILCVASEEDPAVPIVVELLEKYRHADAWLKVVLEKVLFLPLWASQL